MDSTETLVEEHLKARFGSVVYEPDGNVSPDFLVDGKIAIEARRLNQNINGAGLEESAIPLSQRMDKLLKGLGPPTSGRSWFITYRYSRPIEKWHTLGPQIIAALKRFAVTTPVALTEIEITDAFTLTAVPSQDLEETQFLWGGTSDLDSGGWLLSEMIDNLRIALIDKTPKINRQNYKEWWLALSDHIGHPLSERDRSELIDLFKDDVKWDRIIIIDPRNAQNFFEILPK